MARTKQTSRRPVSDVRRAIIVKSATFTTKCPKAPKHKTVPMKAPTLQGLQRPLPPGDRSSHGLIVAAMASAAGRS
jgi:hypothetical protein